MRSWHDLRLSNLSNRKIPKSALCLLCIAKDELYFLPFFLGHYRKLGVRHFIFLDDNSTDGSIEYLLGQPDVTLLQSNFAFNDEIDGLRFGVAIRGKLSKQLFPETWSLIADADEFWFPPQGLESLSATVRMLAKDGHRICKGIMFDCFPRALSDIDSATKKDSPFRLNPFTDSLGKIVWNNKSEPERLKYENNVRNRLFISLQEDGLVTDDFVRARGIPNLYKVPLIRWAKSISLVSAHRLNSPYTDTPIMKCAHYKFFPGWHLKVKAALASGAYYNNSVEYKFLRLLDKHRKNQILLSNSTVNAESFFSFLNFSDK